MIVRCAKCSDLLAYVKVFQVDRCHNGCDAGVVIMREQAEGISDCWYTADAENLRKLREKEATPEICCEKTTCWYKASVGGPWLVGFFLRWSTNWVEVGSGPRQFPVALIKDATDSLVHVVYAGHVSFSPDNPEKS